MRLESIVDFDIYREGSFTGRGGLDENHEGWEQSNTELHDGKLLEYLLFQDGYASILTLILVPEGVRRREIRAMDGGSCRF